MELCNLTALTLGAVVENRFNFIFFFTSLTLTVPPIIKSINFLQVNDFCVSHLCPNF